MGVMAEADEEKDLGEICAVGQESILDPSLATIIPTVFDNERPFLTTLITAFTQSQPFSCPGLGSISTYRDRDWPLYMILHSTHPQCFALSTTLLSISASIIAWAY